MKDLRAILIKGLIPAMKTATGRDAISIVPKPTLYPYIYIAEIYQKETGAKTSYMYELDTLIQVVHRLDASMSPLFTDMDNVMSLVKKASTAITLDSPYTLLQCVPTAQTTTEVLDEIGRLTIGLIRLTFLIH